MTSPRSTLTVTGRRLDTSTSRGELGMESVPYALLVPPGILPLPDSASAVGLAWSLARSLGGGRLPAPWR
jgi:hypothetical protein